MVTVKNINEYIDSFAPYNTQCSFDNCGFLVGQGDKEVDCVAVALDLTSEVLEKSIKAGAQLIITHHPVIFHAKKNIVDDDLILKTIQKGISVISAHTCFDIADGGVNDVLASLLGLKNVEKVPDRECILPMSRIGETDEETDAVSFAKKVSRVLGSTVQLVKGTKPVSKVAVCGGAGMSFMEDVMKMGADTYVTGEAKYNELLEAGEAGLNLIVAGHFETEYPSMKVICEKLEKEFPELKTVLIDQSRAVEYISDGT